MAADQRTPSAGCALFGAGIFVAAGVIAALFALLSSDDDTPPSTAAVITTTTTTGRNVGTNPPIVTAPPTSAPEARDAGRITITPYSGDYDVTYRVEQFAADTIVVSSEVRSVQAPFSGRVARYDTEPADITGDPRQADLFVLGGAEIAASTVDGALLTTVPGVPTRSAHVGVDFAVAEDRGLATFLDVARTVVGRECVEYRTKSPVDVVRLEAPTDTDYTDLCIDADGFVLREEWVVAGQLFQRRTAVDVSIGSTDADFDLTSTRLRRGDGGGFVRRVTDDSTAPDVPHLQLASVPEGFEFVGRYVYAGEVVDAAQTGVVVAQIVSLVDVYAGPRGVLVVENGGAAFGDPGVVGDSDTFDFETAIDGIASLRLSMVGTELAFRPTEKRFVRVTSTLPVAELTDLAATLVDTPGGPITPFDDEIDVTGRTHPDDLDQDPVVSDHTHDGDEDHDHSSPQDHTHG